MTNEQAVEIVLVEDNPADAELTMRSLRKYNLANHVTLVEDGEAALELLTNVRPVPRLVILDLKLPKVSGIEILRVLRGQPSTRRVPVVVLTSSSEERDVIDAYELGVNSYVVKPVSFDAFAEAVKELGLYWLLLNRAPEP